MANEFIWIFSSFAEAEIEFNVQAKTKPNQQKKLIILFPLKMSCFSVSFAGQI